jgi:hypothetical protein
MRLLRGHLRRRLESLGSGIVTWSDLAHFVAGEVGDLPAANRETRRDQIERALALRARFEGSTSYRG